MDLSKWQLKFDSNEPWNREDITQFSHDVREKKKEFRKLIRSEFKDICKYYGFKQITPNRFIKLSDENIIFEISFSLSTFTFEVGVAIEPLYIYSLHPGIIGCDMGCELGWFKKIAKHSTWDYEPLENLKEAKKLIITNVIPWFEEFGNPKGIINFILQGRAEEYCLNFRYNKPMQREYLGFSLLYAGYIREGIECLREITKGISEQADSLWKDFRYQLNKYLEIMEKDPAKAPGILEQFVIENKEAMRLIGNV